MRAAILAAGIGRRLGRDDLPPKILLRFGDRSLLSRHLEILAACGIDRLDLAVGYCREALDAEVARLGVEERVTRHFNPQFDRGAIVSLDTLAEVFESGEEIIFMDGDVLYGLEMMERLTVVPAGNYFLMDREIEEGEDPVRLCIQDGLRVDFHKRPQKAHQWWGEWIGFARFTPDIAVKVAAAARRYVEAGRLDEIYEEAIRDVLLAEPPGTFSTIDVTGLPWVEIDFPEDLIKAEREIYPRLLRAASGDVGEDAAE